MIAGKMYLEPNSKFKRPPRMPEVIADRIQASLADGGFQPDIQLPTEPQLALEHAVSRTVIREAARILEQRGLVTIRPGSGMVTTKLNSRPVVEHYTRLLQVNPGVFDDLMEIRLLLETTVAESAARHRTEGDLELLEHSIQRVRDNRDDFDLCLDEDLTFHDLIGRASGNSVASLFVDPINQCLRETYRQPFAYLSRLDSTIQEHEEILNAIRSGNAEEARITTQRHLQRIKDHSEGLFADGS